VAGVLLFLFKAAGSPQNREELSRLRLFLLIATLLFTIGGIADLVIWVNPRKAIVRFPDSGLALSAFG
jgi:hypothetical protein